MPKSRTRLVRLLHNLPILSMGRLSLEKNLGLLVHAYAALLSALPSADADAPRTRFVFVGDGPFRALQALCVELGVPAIFTGQLTGRKLSEVFASAHIMRKREIESVSAGNAVCVTTRRTEAPTAPHTSAHGWWAATMMARRSPSVLREGVDPAPPSIHIWA
ncbi:hypothetical protein K438DRAFT_1976629 [Mycena galopus ATCC 62051]|nr:hypothetical protein K438DRAFT_1976629 [Mycena galopus ATCC 62051]